MIAGRKTGAGLAAVVVAAVTAGVAMGAVGDSWQGSASIGQDGHLIYTGVGTDVQVQTGRTFTLTLRNTSKGTGPYTIVARGRQTTANTSHPDFVFTATKVQLKDPNNFTVCSNGKLVAGGDSLVGWAGELTFPAACSPLPGRQYIEVGYNGSASDARIWHQA